MQAVDAVTDRDGRVLGWRARETRIRLLDALAAAIESGPGWRHISIPQVAAAAYCSPASFYQYWHPVELAVFELARLRLDRPGPFPPRLSAVLDLLAAEGWTMARRLLKRIAEAEASALPARDLVEAAGGLEGVAVLDLDGRPVTGDV